MPIQPTGAVGVQGLAVIHSAYEEALDDVEGFSHLILVYWFHRSEGYALKVIPFLDDMKRGLFATRAPRRPNPIGLSVVRLLDRSGCTLTLEDVDVLDGTPLIDIKPYVPAFDARQNAAIGWMTGRDSLSQSITADGRFTS